MYNPGSLSENYSGTREGIKKSFICEIFLNSGINGQSTDVK